MESIELNIAKRMQMRGREHMLDSLMNFIIIQRIAFTKKAEGETDEDVDCGAEKRLGKVILGEDHRSIVVPSYRYSIISFVFTLLFVSFLSLITYQLLNEGV